jgi:hypothetical protein
MPAFLGVRPAAVPAIHPDSPNPHTTTPLNHTIQGWRRSMEDAHLAVPAVNGDEAAAVFGVFDGHGGACDC